MLEDGIDLNAKGYSKEALAISQTIISNFRCNIKIKGVSSNKGHNKNTQPPFPLYVSVKFYSSSGSKTLVNWLYFCVRWYISSIQNCACITRGIANWMISQYNRDGEFLPRTLRKGTSMIIAKDNINQNSKSTTAKRHYHGTSLFIFQFPTEENPGIAVEYGDLDNSSNRSSLKIDAFPSSYTCVKNFLTPLKILPMSSKSFPTTPRQQF